MRADHLSAFADACIAVVQALFGSTSEKGALSVCDTIVPTQAVNISCKVGGDLQGVVLLGIASAAADRIAAKIHGSPVLAIEPEGMEALAEFGRMAGGHALELLAAGGYECDLSDPVVSRGKSDPSRIRLGSEASKGETMHALTLPLTFNGLGSIHVAALLSDHRRRVA